MNGFFNVCETHTASVNGDAYFAFFNAGAPYL